MVIPNKVRGGYNTGAKNGDTYYTGVQEALNAAANNDSDKTVELLADSDEIVTVPDGVTLEKGEFEVREAPLTPDPEPTKKPASSGIKVEYEGGNSFSTSKSAVPTSVEIDGVPVPFSGDGKFFTVGCIDPDAQWVTVRWNSTSVTTNFNPDVTVACPNLGIPKTGDMSVWAAIAEFLGF